jgi:medium-chain acyl-[acyl-carrier-protein] hydrolase
VRTRRRTELVGPWFVVHRCEVPASQRLLCLPHAGGSATAYHRWPLGLPDDVEVWALQLPGRGFRLREASFRRVDDLVAALLPDVHKLADLPVSFFGHSMGALLAYCLAAALSEIGCPAPRQLFVSARRAPSLPYRRRSIHALPDAEFVDALRHFDGIPAQILGHREMLALMLPALRADFELIETYGHGSLRTLSVPIWAFVGADDATVSVDAVQAWRELTVDAFALEVLPGGHFFTESARADVLRLVSLRLADPGAAGSR